MKSVTRLLIVVCALAMAGCATAPGGGSRMGGKAPKGKPLRIGVILPLSGAAGIYGRSTLHGIECAAGVKPPCESRVPIELIVKDADGDPVKVATAVRELAAEKVAAIIGPLMSKTVDAAAAQAQQDKIPLISLSQKSSVADVGPYIYSVGMDAESQSKAIASYAIGQRGMKRIAIAYPHNPYGEMYRDLFRGFANQFGAAIVDERGYNGQLGEIIEARQHAKVDETSMSENARRFQLSKTGEVEEVSTAATPIPKFAKVSGADAVFIPDSYRTVVNMLNTYGDDVFGGAVLLGSNRWNSRGILSGGSAVEGALFVDGFFKDSANAETQRFVTVFTQAYNEEPTILEAQAFDALQLVALAAGRGDRDANFVQQRLQRMKKYVGVTGRMQFTPTGRADKDLFVLTVQGGDIAEVSASAGKKRMSSLNAPTPSQQHAERSSVNPKYDVGGSTPSNPPDREWDKY